MTDIIKQLQGFVGDSYPNFFYSDHPQFQAFLDAYFEWLEKDNTETSTNAKDIFKSLPNAGALINHAPEYRDVDLSLQQFLQYFKKEVLPFKIENPAVPDAFLVKKMREVYLAKGTLKSFELLFKLLYNEDIEAFETRDFVLESSEGTFQSSVVCYFAVTGRINDFDNIDFNLSEVFDSDNGVSVVTILDITPVGFFDSDNKTLFLAQLSANVSLGIGKEFVIKNSTQPNFSIKAKVIPSLSQIKVSNSAGFKDTDIVTIKNKTTRRSTTASITTSSGPITHLFIKNRGYGYSVGDEIVFSVDDVSKGDGATAKITKVDTQGRILEIDGVPARTGENNNGVLSGNFEEALVRLSTQGRYKEFPSVSITSTADNTQIAQPYGGTTVAGYGAQISPYSESVGSIKDIYTLSAGAFNDSDDVEILSPAFVKLFNPNGTIGLGNTVVLQEFQPDSDAFRNDSDTVVITIQLSKVSDSRSFQIPYGFDSDNFSWVSKEYSFTNSQGFKGFEAQWDYDNSLVPNNELKKVSFDSDTITLIMEGPLTWSLDDYHWNQLQKFQVTDSEFTFNYEVTHGDPRPVEGKTSGVWVDTVYKGEIYRQSGDQLSVIPIEGQKFPTTEIINKLSAPRNTVLRLATISSITGEPIVNSNIELTNIIVQWSKPEFDFRLNDVWETDKKFIDESGFLNSPSGGVLQDSYVYSYFSYLLQSSIPIGKWRKIVKDTLHPAGMIMVSELKMVSESNLSTSLTVSSEIGLNVKPSIFDAALDYDNEYRSSNQTVSQIYSSSGAYTVTAPNAYDEVNVNGYIVTADHLAADEANALNTNNGNSWWDYEPLGLVRTEDVDTRATQTVQNWTTALLNRRVTTQNQTQTSGKVLNENIYYEKFDGGAQDFYKSNSRLATDRRGIVKTTVTENTYDVYDSEFDPYRYARFSDSDSEALRGFDYNKLKKQTTDTRTFKSSITKRMVDLQTDYENDLQKAMREDNTLTFYNDSDAKTYYNFDAFEMKWNNFNSKRVQKGSSQWQIAGYESWLQNRGKGNRVDRRKESVELQPRFAAVKTPYIPSAWYVSGDSDTIVWTDSYVSDTTINRKTVVEWDEVPVKVNTTYRDPHNSMRGRRG